MKPTFHEFSPFYGTINMVYLINNDIGNCGNYYRNK